MLRFTGFLSVNRFSLLNLPSKMKTTVNRLASMVFGASLLLNSVNAWADTQFGNAGKILFCPRRMYAKEVCGSKSDKECLGHAQSLQCGCLKSEIEAGVCVEEAPYEFRTVDDVNIVWQVKESGQHYECEGQRAMIAMCTSLDEPACYDPTAAPSDGPHAMLIGCGKVVSGSQLEIDTGFDDADKRYHHPHTIQPNNKVATCPESGTDGADRFVNEFCASLSGQDCLTLNDKGTCGEEWLGEDPCQERTTTIKCAYFYQAGRRKYFR